MMSKGEYVQTYKCRLCGEEFKDARTGSKQVADKDVFMTLFCPDAKRGVMQSSMFRIHYCKNGSIGVADFLGLRFEEEKAKSDSTKDDVRKINKCYEEQSI